MAVDVVRRLSPAKGVTPAHWDALTTRGHSSICGRALSPRTSNGLTPFFEPPLYHEGLSLPQSQVTTFIVSLYA